jgi:beta-lactamase regulating signal transducer with metallopeptidase domain
MNAEIFNASDDLMAAVSNGVYQGIILTFLLYLVLRLIGPINAATRYWIWGTTLVLVTALIPAHYFLNRFFPDPARLTNAARNIKPVLDTAPPQLPQPSVLDLADLNPASSIDQELASIQEKGSLVETGTTPTICLDPPTTAIGLAAVTPLEPGNDSGGSSVPSRAEASASVPSSEIVNEAEAKPGWHGWNLERMLNPISWNLASVAGLPKVASVVFLFAWLSIAVLRIGVLSGRLCQIRKVKKTALPAGPELTGLFARLRAELGVRRNVDLRLCPVQASPVALGFFHPLILVPEEYSNNPEASETEHILRHELAHVRRRDDWANLAQNFIQAALFFHPAVWWISKRLALEREIACDDHVLQRGVGPRAYALLLAELAGRLKRQDLVFAQGVSSSKSQLQQRINMILNTRRNTSPGLAKARLGFVTASAVVIALLALYSAPRVVLAQPPNPPPPAAAALPVPAIAAVPAEAPPAPVAIVASADEPDTLPVPPGTPDVGPGPKFKSDGRPHGPSAAPAINMVPVTPAAPSIEIAADVHPKPFPHPPGTPSPDGSLEERIERLEQTVQSLMEQQKHHGAFVLRGRSGGDLLVEQNKEMEKMNQKMNEMAKKHAELAEQQLKRAAEMAERGNKDFNFKWKAEAEQWQKGRGKEGLEKELEALRKAREGLERQMENLDRQIERAERDQERMQEEKERRSELQDEEPKEETASVAESEEN